MAKPEALPSHEQMKIDEYIKKYTTFLLNEIENMSLSKSAFSLFKPHNSFFGVDTDNIHIVLSFDNAVPGMSHITKSNLRRFGKISQDEIIKACRRDLGYKEYAYFNFKSELFELSDSEVDQYLERLSKMNFDIELKSMVMQTKALYIKREKLRQYLITSSEDDFTADILVPLFRQMGFENVKEKGHDEKILEYGKDIRSMKYRLPTGNYMYFSAQIKTGNIRASSNAITNNISNILTQIRMMFDTQIFDYNINKNISLDHVYLISSGKINEQARNLLEQSLSKEYNRMILFLDQDDIINLCISYGLPLEIQRKIDELF